MAIEFVVEDGTSKTDATSYVSVEDFEQYWTNRGVNYTSTDDDEIKVKLNLATQYIDGLYNYQGYKTAATQALEFPRDYLVDKNNVDLSGKISQALKNATCEAANYAFSSLLFENMSNVTSKSIGSVSISYNGSGQKPVKIAGVSKWIGDYSTQLRVYR